MFLSQLENTILEIVQNRQANPGATPNWGNIPDNEYPRAMVDAAINRGYIRLATDLADIEGMMTYTATFPSIAQQTQYTLPVPLVKTTGLFGVTPITGPGVWTIGVIGGFVGTPGGLLPGAMVWYDPVNQPEIITVTAVDTLANTFTALFQFAHSNVNVPMSPVFAPQIHHVTRLFYQSTGMPYTLELEPGARMVSWQTYQRYTASGYLAPFSFAIQPEFCAVDPTRTKLAFWPGPVNTGDVITLEYAALPSMPSTGGSGPLTNQIPLLVADGDVPQLPEDLHEAIAYYALGFTIWPRAKEFAAAKTYMDMYRAEVARAKDGYLRSSAGDSMGIRSRDDIVQSSFWPSYASTGRW